MAEKSTDWDREGGKTLVGQQGRAKGKQTTTNGLTKLGTSKSRFEALTDLEDQEQWTSLVDSLKKKL